jgi:hypothetical protein
MNRDRLDPDLPVLRAAGPAGILQAVPYLLGFHPAESLVLIGLDDRAVRVTARLDLSEADVPSVRHTVLRLADAAPQIIAAVYTGEAPDRSGFLPHGGVVAAVADAVARAGCVLADALLVHAERYWSFLCDDPGCCPPEGNPFDPRSSAFAAAATVAGLVALPDRAAMEQVLDPEPAASREALWPALAEAERAVDELRAAGRAARYVRSVKRAVFAAARDADGVAVPVPSGDEQLVRFGVALRERPVREPVWLAVDHGRLDGRALWLDLARRLPAPYDAAPLFLYGWAAWREGNGALARTAAERAVASDPGLTAADLLLAALRHGVDPRRMPRLRGGRRSA